MTAPQEIHFHVHLDALTDLVTQVVTIKELVMTEADAINALTAKFDSFAEDVRALVAAAAVVRDQLGPDGQTALDSLTAKLDALDVEVGDQNADGV